MSTFCPSPTLWFSGFRTKGELNSLKWLQVANALCSSPNVLDCGSAAAAGKTPRIIAAYTAAATASNCRDPCYVECQWFFKGFHPRQGGEEICRVDIILHISQILHSCAYLANILRMFRMVCCVFARCCNYLHLLGSIVEFLPTILGHLFYFGPFFGAAWQIISRHFGPFGVGHFSPLSASSAIF